VLYALEELEKNFDWLEEGLKELGGKFAESLWSIQGLTVLLQMITFYSTVPVRSNSSHTTPHYAIFSSESRKWVSGFVLFTSKSQKQLANKVLTNS
jgi:hypothetical protein